MLEYTQMDNKVILTKYDSFDIEETLECGQCFRFYKLSEKEYRIIAFNKVLNIKQYENIIIEFYPCTINEFENIWIRYFDLNRNYLEIKEVLSKKDPVLKEAIEFAGGIRILNQDTYECLISFIISQNNRIPMIKKVIENMCKLYGNKIVDDNYTFPQPKQLNKLTIEEIMTCKTGFRAKYIKDAVNKIINKEILLEDFNIMHTSLLRENLMSIYGVGIKVADCVMLFSAEKYEVFPTDVWVKRVMQYFYFDNKEVNIKKIHELAKEKWGDYAGFAQQYLFHYARIKQIGKK